MRTSYQRGETVHLEARVADPKTRKPVDATVLLSSLVDRAGTEVQLVDRAFLRRDEGDYTYALPTDKMVPSVYAVTVTISGPRGVQIKRDRFVLEA